MEFHLPMLPAHGPLLNLQKLIRSVNPNANAKPAREIHRTFSATKTTKVAKHTDPARRASSQRKEKDARAALRRRRRRHRINLNRKLPAANPDFQPKNPVPTKIFEPNDHIEKCIASLNSNHLFIFAAHRNQQAFDRNSRQRAIRKRNAEMDEHDQTADGLRLKRALSEERKRELAAIVAPVDERYRLIKQPGYFDQLNVAPEPARPQESSSNVDYAAIFTEAMKTFSGLRREYTAVLGPQGEDDLVRWAQTQFHILQTVAANRRGSPVAAIQSQYEFKWGRLISQLTSEPVGGTRLYTFPWPSLMFVATVDDITEFRVREFFLNPEGHLANRIDVLNEELVKWHPGTLSKVLHLVTDEDRESIQKGAEIVVESIVGLLQEYA